MEKYMWLGIFLLVLIGVVFATIYLIKSFGKFNTIIKITRNQRSYKTLIGIIIVAVIFVAGTIIFSLFNAFIIVLNLVMFWLIYDVIFFIIYKIIKRNMRIYMQGTFAIITTIIYLAAGLYLNYNVWEKDYSLKTDKEIGSIRVVMFADSHLCTTFDGEGLNEYIDEINSKNPDVVLIPGDFVDDGTDKENMIKGCEALGKLKTRYGVYFSYGNHDKGYYGSKRGFSVEELEAELTKNGVVILQDDAVLIDDRFYIVGRVDRSDRNDRKNMSDLLLGLDTDKYIIVMDHQPHDYKAQSESAADLVVSGHTHGGQLFPITYVGEWMGANDATYGIRTIEDTDFIVTSGISCWEIKFKTGCKSEYVVIDINE